MSIVVKLVWNKGKDDQVSERVSGCCYGCLGRSDSYETQLDAEIWEYTERVAPDVYLDQEDYLGFDYMDTGRTLDEIIVTNKDEPDQAVFDNLRIFDSANADWFKFLRSSPLFEGIVSDYDEYKQGVIRIDAHIPADRMIWILFLIRSPRDYDGCVHVYKAIKDMPELNDFGKVFFSLSLAGVVGRGEPPFVVSRGDGTIFLDMDWKSLRYQLEYQIATEFGYTYSETLGYPMTVNARWHVQPQGSLCMSSLTGKYQQDVPQHRVRGFFIDKGTVRQFRDDDHIREIVRSAYNHIMSEGE